MVIGSFIGYRCLGPVVCQNRAQPIDREKMLLSDSTLEGLVISSPSMVSSVREFLRAGADYVLARRINQDPLEAYFGQQRRKNNRCDTPTVRSFGHNTRIIDIGKSSVSRSNVALH